MKKEDVKNERRIGIVSKHGLKDEESPFHLIANVKRCKS